MFEKNDKALCTSRICVILTIAILALASLILGIVLAVKISGVYFLFTFVGWFICWIMWLCSSLFMSYLCDIKLIRNKLYGESNDGLEDFLSFPEEEADVTSEEEREEEEEPEIGDELEHLNQLVNSGVISREEYERRVNELMKED